MAPASHRSQFWGSAMVSAVIAFQKPPFPSSSELLPESHFRACGPAYNKWLRAAQTDVSDCRTMSFRCFEGKLPLQRVWIKHKKVFRNNTPIFWHSRDKAISFHNVTLRPRIQASHSPVVSVAHNNERSTALRVPSCRRETFLITPRATALVISDESVVIVDHGIRPVSPDLRHRQDLQGARSPQDPRVEDLSS